MGMVDRVVARKGEALATPLGTGASAGVDTPWGVGVDLVSVAEVEWSLGRLGDRYVERLFTLHEADTCRDGTGLRADRLAARFAAKEATLKVLRPEERQPGWRDIEVRRSSDGSCMLVLHGTAATLAAERGFERWAVSVSHDAGMAIAVVMGWGASPREEHRSGAW